VPIETVGLKRAISPNIQYSLEFEGWRAAVHAGLNLWDWENHVYPTWFRAKAIAYYRYDNMISSHSQEAVQDAAKKK